MTPSDRELTPGAFYWVLIVFDPDTNHDWENQPMPARYDGDGRWWYLGMDKVSDWPVRWVGAEIKESVWKHQR